jgi:hypothetical protein
MNASIAKPWNDGADRSPEPERDSGIVLDVLHPNVGDVVRQVGCAVQRDEVDPVRRQATDALHQRLLHETLHEDRGLAIRIDTTPHARVADRTIVVVLHIVFARPHDLHRFANRL